MAEVSFLHPEPARRETVAAISESEMCRYDPKMTGWSRIVPTVATGVTLIGLGASTLLFGVTDPAIRSKEQPLVVFAVGPPPKPPPEATPPAPLTETKVTLQLRAIVPQTLVAVAPSLIPNSAPPAAAPVAMAPAQPAVGTTSAQPVSSTDSEPVYVANPICSIVTPAYPVRAKRLQQTGIVRVAVTIDASGRIVDETVRASSGHDALDNAALAAVRAGKCRPNGNGLAVTSVLPIAFTLDQ